jgi:hypothetical protein
VVVHRGATRARAPTRVGNDRAAQLARWSMSAWSHECKKLIHSVNAEFSETTIHEIEVDGTITPRITVPGYAAVLVKVR